MWSKQYGEPLLSITWNKNNLIAFSHGDSVEIMIWKYPRSEKRIAEEIINESKANEENKWNYYDESSV
jgi:hypothetical protein